MKIKRLDTSLIGGDFRELSFQLLHKPNYLPDCLRDIKAMSEQFVYMTNASGQFMGAYDEDKLGGFWFLGDIVPGHEATFFGWFWDRWTLGTVKSIRAYIKRYVGEYELARVTARTPDDKVYGRMLEQIGFKLEGRFKSAWKGGGNLSTLYCYRILFGGR